MDCPKCGQRLPDGAKFCHHCMTPLNEKKHMDGAAPKGAVFLRRALPWVLSAVVLAAAAGAAVFLNRAEARTDDPGPAASLAAEAAASVGTETLAVETAATEPETEAITAETAPVEPKTAAAEPNTTPAEPGSLLPGGACGEGLTWTFDEARGELVIRGKGAMTRYYSGFSSDAFSQMAPWQDRQEKIRSVILEDGVETVGDGAFAGYRNLESVSIPESVRVVGSGAFAYTSLSAVEALGAEEIQSSAFEGCELLSSLAFSGRLKTVAICAFEGCDAIASVRYGGSPGDWARVEIEEGNERLTKTLIVFDGD